MQGTLSLFIVTLCVINVACSVGPVYVNPNEAATPSVAVKQTVVADAANNNYVTQTVYGFLDFTTTIGNTIMVFSPQSAAAVSTEKPKEATTTSINTQPEPKSTVLDVEIKPSKTQSTISSVTSESKVVVEVSKDQTNDKSSSTVLPSPINSIPKQASAKDLKVSKVMAQQPNTPHSIVESIVQVSSKVEVITESSTPPKPQLILSSHVEIQASPPQSNPIVFSSIVEVHSSDEPEPVVIVENNIGEPEYDFLSRQPSEFAEETYRVVNLRPGAAKSKSRGAATEGRRANTSKKDDTHPTGLVTKLGGTVVKDGVTTVHETSVLGTYISGKYAQVLQSTSHIFHNNVKPKPTPTSSLRILKTAAPSIPKNRHVIEPTPAGSSSEETGIPIEAIYGNAPSPNLVRASRRPAQAPNNFKNRVRNRNSKEDTDNKEESEEALTISAPQPNSSNGANKKAQSRNRSNKAKTNGRNRFSTSNIELATVSVFSDTAMPTYSSRRSKVVRPGFKPTPVPAAVQPTENAYTRRYKPKVQASAVELESQSSSLYKFKLNRTPGRWQYKTTPKPRVTIRKSSSADEGKKEEVLAPTTPSPSYEAQPNDIPLASSRSDDVDLDSSGSVNGDVLNDAETDNRVEKQLPIETLKVEISTPSDFKDTYYEIATIKSPYTFQVGTVRNTRYITVTSTFTKSFEPETQTSSLTEPLTENILATTAHIDKEHNLLDSSIATLPPILLSSDVETPPLETLTETFSTTQVMLKTHILPVLREGHNATSYTLTQTYHVTRLVTATKTLPPMDAYQFIPSKTLKEFNSKLDEAGSELHLELDFGDDEDEDDEPVQQQLPPDLDLSNIGSDLDLADVDKLNLPSNLQVLKKKTPKPVAPVTEAPPMQNLSPEQLQQLAYLRLINPQAANQQLQQVITTSKPIIKLETVFESHTIPIFNGVSTSFSTISRPVATVSRTEYELGTSTLSPILPIPQVPINPYQQQAPQQLQQFQLTTAPIVTQTVVTQTQSKILKLTFGAKTAYTTLFSTNVVPTLLTSFITQSVAIQPTAAFPGYYPPPYAPWG